MIEQIEATTYRGHLAEDEVEIGDSKAGNFKPHAKLSRWNKECALSVELVESGDLESATEDKVIWANGKRKIEFYTVGDEFEFNIVLLEKPTTNIIELNLLCEGLNYHYQGPMDSVKNQAIFTRRFGSGLTFTETQVTRGARVIAYRPKRVVGSYAFYHNSARHNQYKAGKAYHWYAPRLIDADGKEVWADLHISDSVATVAIPQSFLDMARYPIRHAAGATFGRTDVGGANADATGAVDCYSHTHGGSALSYTRLWLGLTGDAGNARGAIYDNSGSAPNNLLVESADLDLDVVEKQVISKGGYWYELAITSTELAASTDYWLAYQLSSSSDQFYYDDDGSTDNRWDAQSYGAFPDPPSTSGGDWLGSLYAETAAAVGTVPLFMRTYRNLRES